MFGNLLNTAMKVIPTQTVELIRFIGREQDDEGAFQNTYAPPVTIRGSFQAVDAQSVKDLGFDSQKNYRRLYTSDDVKGIARGSSPDIIRYAGKRYEVVGDADWYAQDGWKSVYCVEVTE